MTSYCSYNYNLIPHYDDKYFDTNSKQTEIGFENYRKYSKNCHAKT